MNDWDKLMDPAREALEALIAKGDEMADRIEDLEAKLAKVVAVLHNIVDHRGYADDPWGIVQSTLAELTGGKDE